jgi:hypothetical protein
MKPLEQRNVCAATHIIKTEVNVVVRRSFAESFMCVSTHMCYSAAQSEQPALTLGSSFPSSSCPFAQIQRR